MEKESDKMPNAPTFHQRGGTESEWNNNVNYTVNNLTTLKK